jgi:transposase
VYVYVYVNRRGDHLNALYWDRTGFCLWAKRLERGQFVGDWRRVLGGELDVTGLKLLVEGIEPARRRLRYQLGATPSKAG